MWIYTTRGGKLHIFWILKSKKWYKNIKELFAGLQEQCLQKHTVGTGCPAFCGLLQAVCRATHTYTHTDTRTHKKHDLAIDTLSHTNNSF